MQIKVYLTIEVSDPDVIEWENTETGNPIDEINSIVNDINYRIGHLPGGFISDCEIK